MEKKTYRVVSQKNYINPPSVPNKKKSHKIKHLRDFVHAT